MRERFNRDSNQTVQMRVVEPLWGFRLDGDPSLRGDFRGFGLALEYSGAIVPGSNVPTTAAAGLPTDLDPADVAMLNSALRMSPTGPTVDANGRPCGISEAVWSSLDPEEQQLTLERMGITSTATTAIDPTVAEREAYEAAVVDAAHAISEVDWDHKWAVAGHRLDPGVPVPGATPAEFNQMTVQQQYDYFQNLVSDQGGTWKEDGEINIIGIRSFQDGEAVDAEGNVYNDTIYVVRTVAGEPQIDAFTATTDAGVYWSQDDHSFGMDTDRGWGISHLADGFYEDNWVVGSVPFNGTGLRQAGDIQVNIDTSYDGVIQDEERDGFTVGASWGIQFHPSDPRLNDDERVRWSSAGCQVIRSDEYDRFIEILGEAQGGGQTRFSYLLIDSSDLPPVSDS